MQSFPTLKLPYLALLNVIDNLDVETIFVFSLVSNRTKDLAIAARRRVSLLGWFLDFLGTADDHCMCVDMSAPLYMRLPMPKTLEEAGQTEKLERWKLNGQLIPMYRTSYVWFIGDRRGPELIDMLSKHILEVFQCEGFQLCTGLPNLSEDLFVYKHTRQFNELMYSGTQNIPADHLKFALEQLEVSELLKVGPEVPGFRWSGPLTMYRLTVGEANWVTFEALMNNECSVLHLHGHCFTGFELNTFLKKWLAGGFPNLEFCTFEAELICPRDEVLQGVQMMRSNQANHPENQEKHPLHAIYDDDCDYDLSDGVDIRSNAGVLATIDLNSYAFVMAVWRNV